MSSYGQVCKSGLCIRDMPMKIGFGGFETGSCRPLDFPHGFSLLKNRLSPSRAKDLLSIEASALPEQPSILCLPRTCSSATGCNSAQDGRLSPRGRQPKVATWRGNQRDVTAVLCAKTRFPQPSTPHLRFYLCSTARVRAREAFEALQRPSSAFFL